MRPETAVTWGTQKTSLSPRSQPYQTASSESGASLNSKTCRSQRIGRAATGGSERASHGKRRLKW